MRALNFDRQQFVFDSGTLTWSGPDVDVVEILNELSLRVDARYTTSAGHRDAYVFHRVANSLPDVGIVDTTKRKKTPKNVVY